MIRPFLFGSLPHQRVEDWDETLAKTLDTGAPHVSVYDLQIEDGTPFGRWYTPGESPLPSDSSAADMYRLASRRLRGGGYHHYEISNYAKEGFECRHNLTYWHAKPYLAFGLSGASHLAGVRYTRPKGLEQYSVWVHDLEAGRGSPFLERGEWEESEKGVRKHKGESRIGVSEERGGTQNKTGEDGAPAAPRDTERGSGVSAVSGEAGQRDDGVAQELRDRGELLDKILEHVMLRLRLSAGLDLAEMATTFGADEARKVLRALEPHMETGRAILDAPKHDGTVLYISGEGYTDLPREDTLPLGVVRLSDPEGFLVSNDIISSVFAELDESVTAG